MSNSTDFLRDRIQINSVLIVISFVSVLVLTSQAAASYATYLLGLSMLLTVREWNDVFKVPMLWLILALLGYLFLSSFWSDPFERREVFSIFIRVLLIFLFVIAVAECRQRGQLRLWLGRALAVVGVTAAAAAVVVFLLTDPDDGRLNGLGQLSTHVIAALVFGVVLIFLLDQAMTEAPRLWRGFALASALVIAYAIFLSDSRNAWFSVSLGACVFLLARNIDDPRRFTLGVAVLVTILGSLLAGLLLNEATREFLLPREDSYRLVIWEEMLSRITSDGLWFGLGVNTPDNVVIDGHEFLHPHSLYLSVAYQGGLLAFLLLCAMLIVACINLLRHFHRRDAKLALGLMGIGLPAYLLDGHNVVDKVGSTWFLLWLPVAIAFGFAWDRSRSD